MFKIRLFGLIFFLIGLIIWIYCIIYPQILLIIIGGFFSFAGLNLLTARSVRRQRRRRRKHRIVFVAYIFCFVVIVFTIFFTINEGQFGTMTPEESNENVRKYENSLFVSNNEFKVKGEIEEIKSTSRPVSYRDPYGERRYYAVITFKDDNNPPIEYLKNREEIDDEFKEGDEVLITYVLDRNPFFETECFIIEIEKLPDRDYQLPLLIIIIIIMSILGYFLFITLWSERHLAKYLIVGPEIPVKYSGYLIGINGAFSFAYGFLPLGIGTAINPQRLEGIIVFISVLSFILGIITMYAAHMILFRKSWNAGVIGGIFALIIPFILFPFIGLSLLFIILILSGSSGIIILFLNKENFYDKTMDLIMIERSE